MSKFKVGDLVTFPAEYTDRHETYKTPLTVRTVIGGGYRLTEADGSIGLAIWFDDELILVETAIDPRDAEIERLRSALTEMQIARDNALEHQGELIEVTTTLRAQLEAEKVSHLATERILETVTAERDALKPKAPTIVKQTRQCIVLNFEGCTYVTVESTKEHFPKGIIGRIRRDHYSDGTVVVTLEPVGDEK